MKTHNDINYYLVKQKLASFESRVQVMYKILADQVGDDLVPLNDEVEKLWDKQVNKTLESKLKTEDTMILEALGSMLIAGFENDSILNEKRWEKIKKYEVPFYNLGINNLTKNKNYDEAKVSNYLKKSNRHKKSLFRKHFNHIKKYIKVEDEYNTEWCYVNQDNWFECNNREFNICHPKYLVGTNEMADMMKILVIEQYGKNYYFDEKLDLILDKHIIELRKA